ncbi:uncharacterized protein ARMOST_07564 [Armillaria ostoyae]|uniref:Uncharacterized protein n=1 Tax=Armillaria ostoyae TaxID=47428 RepID=A0A284R661_ARMOS|nr:uncharacterized protein ARMOST_07564 [Armillaria ostoyae]
MSKLYIVVAQSELVNWNATALAEHRDGIVAIRSLGRHGHNPHKTLKLYGMDGVLLGSIHFAHSHRRDTWLPCESIEVALNRVRLALGHRLSARVYYNENNHIDFQDELFKTMRIETRCEGLGYTNSILLIRFNVLIFAVPVVRGVCAMCRLPAIQTVPPSVPLVHANVPVVLDFLPPYMPQIAARINTLQNFFEPKTIQNWADIFALNTIVLFFIIRSF